MSIALRSEQLGSQPSISLDGSASVIQNLATVISDAASNLDLKEEVYYDLAKNTRNKTGERGAGSRPPNDKNDKNTHHVCSRGGGAARITSQPREGPIQEKVRYGCI